MKNTELATDFHFLKIGPMWKYFKSQHFSFWMVCCYLVFEFVRPQSIIPAIDFLPWAQLFLLGCMAGVFMDPTVKWVSSAANVQLILFLIVIIISVATAIYPEPAKNYFMVFFNWVLIYFLIILIVNTPKRFYLFLLIYVVAAGKIAVGTSRSWIGRGFSFQPWGLMGPSGYFQNSGELAILMLMLFPLAFYLYQALKEHVTKWERILLIILWVAPILTILGASSRGAQLALVAQMLFMFRRSLFRIKPLISILILVLSITFLLPAEQKERFSNAGDDKSSQQRLLYWEHGWQMMKDYPVTGVGFFNFISYYEDHYPADMLYESAQLPHNIFIQVGTDAGFGAVFLFFLLIIYCLITTYKITLSKQVDIVSRNIASGLGMGVFGYLIAGQFVTVAYYPFLWIHLAFIVCLANLIKSQSK